MLSTRLSAKESVHIEAPILADYLVFVKLGTVGLLPKYLHLLLFRLLGLALGLALCLLGFGLFYRCFGFLGFLLTLTLRSAFAFWHHCCCLAKVVHWKQTKKTKVISSAHDDHPSSHDHDHSCASCADRSHGMHEDCAIYYGHNCSESESGIGISCGVLQDTRGRGSAHRASVEARLELAEELVAVAPLAVIVEVAWAWAWAWGVAAVHVVGVVLGVEMLPFEVLEELVLELGSRCHLN